MSAETVRYGCRVTLYRQSLGGYVVSTSSAVAQVGLKQYSTGSDTRSTTADPERSTNIDSNGFTSDPAVLRNAKNSLAFEQAIFIVCPGDPVEANSSNRGEGDPIKYGQLVLLRHQTHQKPLGHHTEQHAAGLKGNLRVILENRNGSSQRYERWRVMPRYRLRVEGEPVVDGDPVLLQSVDGEHYLNCADRVDPEIGGDDGFYEVSCGSELQGFQVGVYDGDVGPHFPAATLRCGDCVTLLHTEEHKYVLADVGSRTCLLQTPEARQGGGALEDALKRNTGTNAESNGNYSSSNDRDGRAPSGNAAATDESIARRIAPNEEISYLSLFVIEAANPTKGGAVCLRAGSGLYRLKSLATGLYLQVGRDAVSTSAKALVAALKPEVAASMELAATMSVGGVADLLDATQAVSVEEMMAAMALDEDSDSDVDSDMLCLKQGANKKGLYKVSLTPNARESGTLFRLRSAATTSGSHCLNSGSHVFLEAPQSRHGRLFLTGGAPVQGDGNDSIAEVTVASLASPSASTGSVGFYGSPSLSMRDGIQVQRLRPAFLEELSLIRSLLPPLERYAARMLRGLGDANCVREVRENLFRLQQLCVVRPGAPSGVGSGAAGLGVAVGAASVISGTASVGGAPQRRHGHHDGDFSRSRNLHGGVVDPLWQTKMFNQGVPALVLQVAYSTIHCPYVKPAQLHTDDMVAVHGAQDSQRVVHFSDQEASANEVGAASKKGKGSGLGTLRYSQLGDLVDMCLCFVSKIVTDRPHYAHSLSKYADFLMRCCEHVPSALKCLAVFYKDNPTYVELPMARSRLDFFLKMLVSRGRDPDVLEIVRLFAQCGEESMVEAQQVILDFFSNREVAKNVLVPVSMMKPPGSLQKAALAARTSGGSPLSASRLSFNSAGEVALSTTTRQDSRWVSELDGHTVVIMVGLPNSMFVEESKGESVSIATSMQYRGRGSFLGELLTRASNAEDIKGMTYFPLLGLTEVLQDWPEVKDVFMPYYIAQVELLAALSSGRNNSKAEEVVFQWVPRDVLVRVISEDALPRRMRSAYVSLFAHCLVDTSGSLHIKQSIRNIHCVINSAACGGRAAADSTGVAAATAAEGSELSSTAPFAALPTIRPQVEAQLSPIESCVFVMDHTPEHLEVANEHCTRFLSRATMSGEADAAGEILACLHLLEVLINCGAVAATQYPQVASLLANLVDPLTDDRHSYLEVRRVHDCRMLGMRILSTLVDILLARTALDMVQAFQSGTKIPPFGQIFPLAPRASNSDRRSTILSGHSSGDLSLEEENVPGAGGSHSAVLVSGDDDVSKPSRQNHQSPLAGIGQKIASGFPHLLQRTSHHHSKHHHHHHKGRGHEAAKGEETPISTAELTARLLEVLTVLSSTTQSTRVRAEAIHLFYRITNYTEELYETTCRVQLLTSHASIGFFSGVNNISVALDVVNHKSFRRMNTIVLARNALRSLSSFLAEWDSTTEEKLTMIHRVGIHHSLVAMLEQLPLPLTDARRALIGEVVTLLVKLCTHAKMRKELRGSVQAISPLVWQQTSLLTLFRTLFSEQMRVQDTVPRRIIIDVVKCLPTAHSASAATAFLIDFLSVTNASGMPVTHHQQVVWRALVSDPMAVRRVHFRSSWCGDRGSVIRERAITGRDYYDSDGRLARHLSLCRLLYLIANRNELVKPEEIRHEVFGMNSVDSLLEVCTDRVLPAFFRKQYLSLLEVLVLDDRGAVSAVFAHRGFPDLLEMCALDTARYMQLCGGQSVFPEMDEEVERREGVAMSCPPVTEAEEAIDRSRFGESMYRSFFFGPVCESLQRICTHYHNGVEGLNNRLRSVLFISVNETIDVVCDLVQIALRANASSDGVSLASAGRAGSVMSTETLAPGQQKGSPTLPRTNTHREVQPSEVPLQWAASEWGAVRACLREARDEGFFGSARWRGEHFTRLLADLDQKYLSVLSAEKVTRAAASSASPLANGNAPDSSLIFSQDSLVLEGIASPNTLALAGGGASATTPPVKSAPPKDETQLMSNWTAFLETNLLQSESMEEAHLYASAAGVLLRTGDHGTAFVRTLLCTLPAMGADYVTRTLQLVRQLVLLQKDDPHDASSVLPFREMESELPCLSLDMTLVERQSLLAKWPGDQSLEYPVPLLALAMEYVGAGSFAVRRAALLGAITLLTGGHRGMQESYYRYCMSTPHEQLFFVLRNHMTGFLDELRTYHYALTRGSTPSEAQHFLKHMAGCTLELQLLRLLCAGQFAPIQTYLVAQPDNTVSVNLIELLVDLVSMGPKAADEVTAPFFLQLLSTISETLQGPCRVNQDSFVAYKVADFLTHMLSEHTLSISTPEEARVTRLSLISSYEEEMPVHQTQKADGDGATSISEVRRGYRTRLQTAALSTLLALIEGRQDPTFAARLLATVDLSVLGRSMDRSAAAYEHRHGSIVRVHSRGVWKGDIAGSFRVLYRYFRDFIRDDLYSGREELQDELALGVSIYTFFRALYDMQALATMAQLYAQAGVTGGRVAVAGADLYFDKMGRSIKQVLRKTQSYKKIGSRVSKVEVVRNGVLERVYFRVLAASEDNWYAEMRHRTVEKAIRSSDNDRLQYFFKRSSNIVVEMDTYGRLRKIPPLFLLNYSVVELTALLLCMIVAINLVMAIGIRAPTSPYSSGTSKGIDSAMFGLSVAIIIAQGLRTLHALLGPAAVNVIRGWRLWRLRREERLAQEVNADMAADAGDYERLLAAINADGVPWYSRASRTIALVALTPAFLQQGFFLFVSIMGFVQHPIWHSAQLLQIVLSSSVLMNLFNALLVNVTSLILTFVLLLLMIFISSAISFFNFAELFDPLGSYGNGMNCYTLSQCWLVHLDTLRLTGGMGDIARWPTFYSEDGYGYWFAFFRLAYFVVVCLIVSNMFFGVVVDSLAQSRVARDFVKVDQQKKCFICGVERNVFDVIQPGMYDTHIKEEHNMWQYVFFLHYLSEKDPDTFTGQEAYVSHLISLRDITFYPIGRSVVLDTLGERGTDQSARVQGDQTLPNGPAGTMEERLLEIMRGALDPVRENQRNIQDTLRVVLEKLGNVTSNGGALNPSTKSSS